MSGPLLTTSKSLLMQWLCTILDYWVVNTENACVVLGLCILSELPLLVCLPWRSASCDSGFCHCSMCPAREWIWKEESTCLEASLKMEPLTNPTSTRFMTMLWLWIMASDKDSRLFLLFFKQRRLGLRENTPQVAFSDERKQTQNVDQDFISCMCVSPISKQERHSFI